MKYTPPKLHKLWIKEKIGEGVLTCPNGNENLMGCLPGATADLMCNVGTSVTGTCQTGNTAEVSCNPGYGFSG